MSGGRRALLLAAHGSRLDPRSGEAVRAHARRLAALGGFGETLTGFWKEEPPLARALDGCRADEVIVVPAFMAEGFFVNEVVPAELGLEGPVTRRDGRTLRLARPLGTHPLLAEAVAARALEAGASADGAVFVLGHGHPRDPRSARAVRAQVGRMRATGRFARVEAVFTDQQPGADAIPMLADGREATVVPFFAADGWHVGRAAEAIGANARLAAPAGTHALATDALAALAREAARERGAR